MDIVWFRLGTVLDGCRFRLALPHKSDLLWFKVHMGSSPRHRWGPPGHVALTGTSGSLPRPVTSRLTRLGYDWSILDAQRLVSKLLRLCYVLWPPRGHGLWTSMCMSLWTTRHGCCHVRRDSACHGRFLPEYDSSSEAIINNTQVSVICHHHAHHNSEPISIWNNNLESYEYRASFTSNSHGTFMYKQQYGILSLHVSKTRNYIDINITINSYVTNSDASMFYNNRLLDKSA